MTERQLTITENYKTVKEKIDLAVTRRGDSSPVTLLAATKTVPADEIIFAADTLGLTVAGENKVQEFQSKFDDVTPHLKEYHFIGHLQTNKVKYLVGRCPLIHSAGSVKLLREIDRLSAKAGVTQDVLLELNCASEEAKSGFLPEEIAEAIAMADEFSAVNVRGIMTMGPPGVEKSVLRKYFQETYKIFIDNFGKKPHNIREYILSMGMSDSYELAIEEGANLVRVGSAIFGRRTYL